MAAACGRPPGPTRRKGGPRGLYHYYGFRDYLPALDALDRAEAVRPNDDDVHLTRAAILRRMGRFHESVAAFEMAISLNPLGPSAQSNLGMLHAMARDYEEARRWSARVTALAPNQTQQILEEGKYALWELGETEDLRAATRAVEGHDDWNGILTLERWRVEYLDGETEAALVVLDEFDGDVLEYQTYWYPIPYLQGLTLRAAGNEGAAAASFREAQAELERTIIAMPGEPRPLATLGNTLAALGDTERAIAVAREATEALSIEYDALDGPEYVLDFAATLSMLDMGGAAIDQLLVYFNNLGFWSPQGLLVDPAFAPLGEHPRWPEVDAAASMWRFEMERDAPR